MTIRLHAVGWFLCVTCTALAALALEPTVAPTCPPRPMSIGNGGTVIMQGKLVVDPGGKSPDACEYSNTQAGLVAGPFPPVCPSSYSLQVKSGPDVCNLVDVQPKPLPKK